MSRWGGFHRIAVHTRLDPPVPAEPVINFDKLTYAGNLENLAAVAAHSSHRLVRGDICDAEAVRAALPEGCDAIVTSPPSRTSTAAF